MKFDILLGLQWGDEGKGKIVDVLGGNYDLIARFQGGPNAGHSIEFNNKKYILHLIPSGIFSRHTLNLIGNGVVIDPAVFKKEVESLGIPAEEVKERLVISRKAHLILPGHRILDAAIESDKGCRKIGSTLRGIGPAYTDKVARNGLRAGDIFSADFEARYKKALAEHRRIAAMYNFTYELAEYEAGWFEGIEMMRDFKIINSEYLINNWLASGKKILAEGAQGTMLDIDFGSYPFVTSSNTISAGACTGLGIAPGHTGEVFGIFKAYCTRVGSGPFPTELEDNTGEYLRKKGAEFGSTTGRPRRCGWLDLPALKYAIMINGVTQLFLTKADVLTGLDKLKICTAYLWHGTETTEVPFDQEKEIVPVYKEMESWKEDISQFKSYNDLPPSLKEFVTFIENYTSLPVTIISTGPDRNQTIFR